MKLITVFEPGDWVLITKPKNGEGKVMWLDSMDVLHGGVWPLVAADDPTESAYGIQVGYHDWRGVGMYDIDPAWCEAAPKIRGCVMPGWVPPIGTGLRLRNPYPYKSSSDLYEQWERAYAELGDGAYRVVDQQPAVNAVKLVDTWVRVSWCEPAEPAVDPATELDIKTAVARGFCISVSHKGVKIRRQKVRSK